MDIMLDIETLGKAAGCVVLSIGATTFDGKRGLTHNHFHSHLELEPQIKAGLTMDASTTMWWLKQAPDAQQAILEGQKKAVSPVAVLEHFAGWYTINQGERIWANGSDFDLPILAAVYRAFGKAPPWEYNAGRCCRTLMSLTGKKMGAFGSTNLVAHDALSDAVYQASEISAALRHLSTVGV
jgi:hypothetical protein